jgi:mannosyltransferase
VKVSKNAVLALMIVITLGGFMLRLYKLDSVPLRGDEAFSVQYWAQLPLSQSLTTIATIEPHPLLTYVTFHAWGLLAGAGAFAMRLLPALVNLLGIPALYALGKRLGGRKVGLIAALFWAMHPLEIWHAQDVRNYGIWAGVSAVALWLGYRAVQHNRRTDWLLYAIGVAIAANIYYDELFTLAAFALFVILTQCGNWSLVRRTLIAQSLAVITAGLSFVIFQWSLLTRGGYGGTAGNFDGKLLPSFLTTLTLGKDLPPNILWLVILLALLAGIFIAWRHKREQALFLGLMAVVPLIILSILSLKIKIFAPHYILSAVPAYILIFATLIGRLSDVSALPYRLGRVGAMVIGVGWLAGAGYTLNNYYNDPAYVKASNWPRATHFLHDYVKADDLVIQLAVDPAFGYYYDAPALDIALPSYPAQPAEEIVAKLEEFTTDHRGIWLVGQTYPDWPSRGVVETWMHEHFQPVLNTQAADLHIQVFMPWDVKADEIEPEPLEVFGDVAELVGLEIFHPADVGEAMTVWLYWRAIGQSDTPLKVFLHVGDNPIVSQDDQYPQDGRIDTSTWTLGQIYRDIYVLPMAFPSVTSGTYDMYIGWYEPETNQRLLTQSGPDQYDAQPITIEGNAMSK